jgi:hypothetical protein
MLKSFNKIIAILLLIVVGLLIWKAFQEQIPYNIVSLSGDNYITNQTEYHFADTALAVALDIAEVKGVSVIIRELTSDLREKFREDNTVVELNAAIFGGGNQYLLYVSKLTRRESLKVMAHEVIHLMQYRSKRLQVLPPKTIIWESDTITSDRLYDIPYGQRPWEREAFDGEDGLASQMDEILYGKNM